MERIGIFGGTFNPPHMGHINGAKACISKMNLDMMIFVPASIPPHKALPEHTASASQRLDMTRLAAKQVEKAQVSDIELKREGPSYTVDTLMALKLEFPRSQLFFIMGSDMLLSFEKWRNVEKISSLCTVVALCRNLEDKERMKHHSKMLFERFNTEIILLEHSIITVSSTDIRQGEKVGLVPQEVLDYIRENGIYNLQPKL